MLYPHTQTGVLLSYSVVSAAFSGRKTYYSNATEGDCVLNIIFVCGSGLQLNNTTFSLNVCCKGCCFGTLCMLSGGGVYFRRNMHEVYFSRAKKKRVFVPNWGLPFLSPACYNAGLVDISRCIMG